MEYGDSHLLAQFRQFYAELVHLKRQVRSGAWLMNVDGESPEHPDYGRAASGVSASRACAVGASVNPASDHSLTARGEPPQSARPPGSPARRGTESG